MNVQPAGTKTVFPSRLPGYRLRTCSAVIAAKGTDAASAMDQPAGFNAIKSSLVLANSLHAPKYF
jgi:hypothetical protein